MKKLSSRLVWKISRVLFMAGLLATSLASAEGPIQIGETEDVLVESPRPYESTGAIAGVAWSHTFRRDDATFVRLHFSVDSAMGQGDRLQIRDQFGVLLEFLDGQEPSDYWTNTIPGPQATVELIVAAGGGGNGIAVDRIAWGTDDIFPVVPIAGTNDGFFTLCNTAVPSRIRTADPVARINFISDCGGVFSCSAWLFSVQGHLMTNAHCANSISEGNSLECWFNYMSTSCDRDGRPNPDSYRGTESSFLHMNCNLDYAVHVIDDPMKGNPAEVYGYLKIDPVLPADLTEIWIPQHPGGQRKQIAESCFVNDNIEPGFNGCADPPAGCNNEGFAIGQSDLSFNCDIAGGSSGSPVLNTNDKVIAIAHAGNQIENYGVRMSAIVLDIPNPPVQLVLSGPPDVAEGQSASFTAVASYLVSSDRDVTNRVNWSVQPPSAGTITTDGVFTAASVNDDTKVIIAGTFEDAAGMVSGATSVTVLNVNVDTSIIRVHLAPSVDPMKLLPGQQFTVDLSVSSDPDSIPDVRLLQFDVGMSVGVTLNQVEWDFELLSSSELYLPFLDGSVPSATYIGLTGFPGFIVGLNQTPQRVARLHLTFLSDGQLDVFGSSMPPTTNESIRFLSGFDVITEYSQSFQNVIGDALPVKQADVIPGIHMSLPPDGAIDARQPSEIDGSAPAGWSQVDLVFNGAVSGITLTDFELTQDGGRSAPPSIADLALLNASSVRLSFSDRITPGAWTTIEHLPSGTAVRLGFLPGDVSGDGTSGVLDVLALIDSLNGVGPILSEESTDIDRSLQSSPFDVLREIDLLNGAGEFDEWNGVSLP